jgi:hypothetical protein
MGLDRSGMPRVLDSHINVGLLDQQRALFPIAGIPLPTLLSLGEEIERIIS